MVVVQAMLSVLAAAWIGRLVLARSLPLAGGRTGREGTLSMATAWLTALMAAGLASLAVWLALAWVF